MPLPRRLSLLLAAVVPAAFVVPAQSQSVTRTFQVSAGGSTSWTIDGQSNPPISLQRGSTYVFHLNGVSAIHPFNINTINAPGPNFLYNNGVTNNGAVGTTDITFVVPADAPNSLHYNCENHVGMNGPITITAPEQIFVDGFESA